MSATTKQVSPKSPPPLTEEEFMQVVKNIGKKSGPAMETLLNKTEDTLVKVTAELGNISSVEDPDVRLERLGKLADLLNKTDKQLKDATGADGDDVAKASAVLKDLFPKDYAEVERHWKKRFAERVASETERMQATAKAGSAAELSEEEAMVQLLGARKRITEQCAKGEITEEEAKELNKRLLQLSPLYKSAEPMDLSASGERAKRRGNVLPEDETDDECGGGEDEEGDDAASESGEATPPSRKKKRVGEEEKKCYGGSIAPIRLSKSWTVFVKLITFEKGSSQGAFEVLALERAPRDEKKKPYGYHIPLRFLPCLIESVEKLAEEYSGQLAAVEPNSDLSKLSLNAAGELDISGEFNTPWPSTGYGFDIFEVYIGEEPAKHGQQQGGFEGLIIAKTPKRTGVQKATEVGKKYSICVPLSLIKPFLAALKHMNAQIEEHKMEVTAYSKEAATQTA